MSNQLSLPFPEWMDIPGLEGLYRISDAGKVYSITTDRIMKSWIQPNGYESVILTRNGVQKHYTVHSLVLLAFEGERPEKMIINHRDGNKKNNYLSNLEYATQQQNVDHAWNVLGHSTAGTKNSLAKLDDDKVREIRRLYREGVTLSELARMYGVRTPTMNSVLKRKTWKHVAD